MKNILVIGANRGIGLEFVRQFKDLGAQVTATCRKTSNELEALGVNVVSEIQITNLEDLKRLASIVDETQPDTIVHVAGIMRATPLDNFDASLVEEQFQVNALAPLLAATVLIPHLKAGTKYAFLTSRMGSIADNDSGGAYGYRMSKAALNAGLKSLSIDVKDKGISIAILHPGWVKTDMTNHNGMIDTKESVEGMLKILQNLDLENSGSFWHTNGETLPW